MSDGVWMRSPSAAGPGNLGAATRGALLDALLESIDDAVFSHDADLQIITWNRSAERIFGYPEHEIVGQQSLVLFPEHLRSEVKLLLDTVGDGDRVDHYETEVQRKDGMPVPISLSLCPVFDDQRRLVASVAIARDITEQRLAQATLAEIETRIREAEALAHVGGWLWDIRTGAVQWSDELHRIHGIDPLEFEGTFEAHVSCIHPDDRPRVQERMHEAVATARPFEEEYRVVRPDGEQRWVFARAEPTIGSTGAVVGLRGIGQDMTARRRPREEER
jgi:PAS domain S-box-containing protein